VNVEVGAYHQRRTLGPRGTVVDYRVTHVLLLYGVLVCGPLGEYRVLVNNAVHLSRYKVVHVPVCRERVYDVHAIAVCQPQALNDGSGTEAYLCSLTDRLVGGEVAVNVP